MRILPTVLMTTLCLMPLGTSAQAQEADLHPTLGKKPPMEVLNRDVLALPERERQAFIHGAMVQMIQLHSTDTHTGGRCLTGWYFEEGDGRDAVQLVMETYPDYPTVTALYAMAKRVCPMMAD